MSRIVTEHRVTLERQTYSGIGYSNFMIGLWGQRCTQICRGSKSDKIRRKKTRLFTKVRQLKGLEPHLMRQGLFHLEINLEESARTWELRAWIKTSEALFRQALKYRARQVWNNSLITDFFRLDEVFDN